MAMDAVSDQLTKLSLTEKSAVSLEKATPDYVLHVALQSTCGANEAKFAANTTDHNIRLYNSDTLSYSEMIKGGPSQLTGVKFSHQDPNNIFASSVDGTVRCWDLRQKRSSPAQSFSGRGTADAFSAFDLSCDDRLVCAGTDVEDQNVSLYFWDRRSTEQLRQLGECHQDDVTQVVFHPTQSSQLVTGSTDGLLCLLDISQTEDDDALLVTFNSESSVAKAGWCGPDMKHVYCVTHIETLLMWESVEFDPVTTMKDIREQHKSVEYIVDVFQPHPETLPHLLTGDHRGGLQLWTVSERDLNPVSVLNGGHNDDIRCMCWNSEQHTLVTGGDDSMLCLWTTRPSLSPSKTKQQYKMKKKSQGSARRSVRPF